LDEIKKDDMEKRFLSFHKLKAKISTQKLAGGQASKQLMSIYLQFLGFWILRGKHSF
jgi:hypothetical protein